MGNAIPRRPAPWIIMAGEAAGQATQVFYQFIANLSNVNSANAFTQTQTMPGLVLTPVLFADLPANPVDGQKAQIVDSTTTTFFAMATGFGGNRVPVYYDAVAGFWRVG